MKTRTITYLHAFILLAVFTFASCSKDEENKVEEKKTKPLDEKELAAKDYNEMYVGSAVSGFSWNGNTSDCNAGTLPQEILDKALLRVKYFRKAAGLSNEAISLNADFNAKSQQAALMMKANNALSHFPPNTWSCYTAEGAEAAENGNIAFGVSDVENINLWMEDEGNNNTKVGHRRWILYSRATQFGFGSTSNTATLWVINSGVGSSALPAVTPEYVAWPPKGFVPQQVVYPRWSLSVPYATFPYKVNFTNATITMKNQQGEEIATLTEDASSISNSYVGDNTIVWRPSGIVLNSETDQKYSVKVANVLVNGVAKTYEYDVVIFKP